MTRQELSQVYYLKRELKMWEKKLEEAEDGSFVKAQSIDGMPFQNTGEVSDKVAERAIRNMEIRAEIDAFRLNIEYKINEIEKYIMTLDDSLLRQIIEYRCCRCMTWDRTAAMIGAGTTADSIRKYYDRRFPKK